MSLPNSMSTPQQPVNTSKSAVDLIGGQGHQFTVTPTVLDAKQQQLQQQKHELLVAQTFALQQQQIKHMQNLQSNSTPQARAPLCEFWCPHLQAFAGFCATVFL